jgi:hypothetical protein
MVDLGKPLSYDLHGHIIHSLCSSLRWTLCGVVETSLRQSLHSSLITLLADTVHGSLVRSLAGSVHDSLRENFYD